MRMLANDEHARRELAMHGHRTILSRHTCAHRVDELIGIYHSLESTQATTNGKPHNSMRQRRALAADRS
jgi:spore maturation protein CgeB